MSVPLKLFKRLLHGRKGDDNLQGLAVMIRWTFNSRKVVGEPVTSLVLALMRTSAMEKLKEDLQVLAPNNEKSVEFQLFRYCPAQSGFPMRASDSSVGGNANWVAKVQVGNRALIAAQGRLKP